MAISWILVAHRAGARVFESRGPAGALELVREIDHAEGRAHDRDIDTDRAGTGVQGTHVGGRGFVREKSATETLSEAFARELVDMLDGARNRARFHKLVIVAPPRFLGWIREAMPKPLARKVVGTLAKDLPEATPDALRARLADIARV